MVLFFHHVLVLTVLAVFSAIHVFKNPQIFKDNMKTELPPVDFLGDIIDSNVFTAIFFGFAGGMLGITGFESSAQFVEEQQPGVFRKTLRNMWAFVSVFNTVLSILSLGVLPMEVVYSHPDTVLAEMGRTAAGRWLSAWIAYDAFGVLSGAVLTSYVGITGLCRRLASDRVLPAFLLTTNKWRGTNHIIILLYFVIASSFVIIRKGDNAIMGGVYAYSFLSLMSLFCLGCMILKAKRAEIPRDISAPWWTCIFGLVFVVVGMLGNLLGDPKVLTTFSLYFIIVVLVMMAMLDRVTLLKALLAVMTKYFPSRAGKASAEASSIGQVQMVQEDSDVAGLPVYTDMASKTVVNTGARGGRTITKAIMDINEAPIVFFCKHPDMTVINKAILYVRKNEQTHNLRIVHVANDSVDGDMAAVHRSFENIVALFDHIYPKLKIDFVSVQGEFEPAMVQCPRSVCV
ncbi:hypothetical protein ATCC90586_011782 [Pythium insidiosum]|nr:hypothetical protein ATCC90586_011782 [Pythium insidiosum]